MTQYKEGVWLRWPLNVARHAWLQSSVLKKLFPLNLSMVNKWLTPALLALLPSFEIYQLLFMSHLSSHTICHHEARHIICPLNSNIMHRAMVYGPENPMEHISENSTPLQSPAWPQGGIRQAAWVYSKELVLQIPIVIKFTILFFDTFLLWTSTYTFQRSLSLMYMKSFIWNNELFLAPQQK